MNRFFYVLVRVLLIVGFIFALYNKMTWKDSVKNPENDEYVTEIAFNRGIEKHEVKQWMFNQRYQTSRLLP